MLTDTGTERWTGKKKKKNTGMRHTGRAIKQRKGCGEKCTVRRERERENTRTRIREEKMERPKILFLTDSNTNGRIPCIQYQRQGVSQSTLNPVNQVVMVSVSTQILTSTCISL